MLTAEQRSPELSDRQGILEEYGYNVVNIHPSRVEFDLMTDSWNELASAEIAGRMASLLSQADYSDTHKHAADVFPFQHFINVSQGRAAEAFFWRSAAKKDKKVIQNLLFPTTRHHVVANRMAPVELPLDHVFNRQSADLFRGNLDCAKFRNLISTEGSEGIAHIYIEAENNASGGYPVSMANVREIREIVSGHDIQMVLDATRLVENAVLIQKHEPGYADKSVREIVHEFCSYFDAMTCSLAKDFGINRGGLIATNNERLYYRAIDTVATYGPGINVTDKAVINAALKDWNFVEQMSKRRVEQAARLHAAFVSAGLPIITPAPGHCLLFDVADYLDIKQYKNPVTAFVSAIYEQSGVRGGMHVSGMTREYAKPTFVRFAIPLCTPDAKIDALTAPFVAAFKSLNGIPDLIKTSTIPGIYGQMHALYKPVA
jgi:polyketide synthase PksN